MFSIQCHHHRISSLENAMLLILSLCFPLFANKYGYVVSSWSGLVWSGLVEKGQRDTIM